MALPIIRGTSQALYPYTLTISFDTGLGQWQGGGQQRWAKRHGLVKLELPYDRMTQAEKNTLKGDITSAKGKFDNTLSVTIGATTYTNLGLDSDEWTATEGVTKQYSGPVKLSQAISQSLSPGTAGAAFPTLANGCMGVLPYSQKKRFQTVSTKMEAGPNYTFAEYGGGLSGYPTDGLMAWTFSESKLSDVDTATRVQHFIDNYGRFHGFTFTDEDSTAYTATHYASDELAVTYRGVNDASVRIMLEATN